jgi:heme oxygenase
MRKENVEKLIKEFEDLDSKHTLEETIQSILDDTKLTDAGKLKFIRIILEMNKANEGILEILETELKKLKQ